ncbi:MAG: tripartite tricarboxylate transporter TctB family protein [Spirochaetes bacterium]|nr:tripartite tricarboxylate transporter TctB family protein [Spirochaetota bacterium]
MTEKSMLKADFFTSLVLTAFGAAVLILSIQMPILAEVNQSQYSAPGIVPGFIGVMLILLSGSMLIRSLKRNAFAEIKEGLVPKSFFTQETTRRIGLTVLLCVLYAFFLGKLWFPIPTFLFIFIFISVFEYDFKTAFKPQMKKVIVAAIIGLITTIAVTLVFQKLFLVNLP